MMSNPNNRSVHKIFIAAPIDKVWQQITQRDGLQAQFFNARLDTPGLAPGAPIRMRTGKDGKYTSVVGEVLTYDPPHEYSHTFKFTNLDDPYCTVIYLLKAVDGGTEFTLINEDMPAGSKTEKYMVQGADFILQTLKGLMESGKPPFKSRLLLAMIGLFAFATPKRCRSEHWPFDLQEEA
ncbi:SRPBCC domain-containing protein [Aestuariibacter halophilus]|uniref:SRPBCC domain-containing protein n=1 Tax=Fluctibacter halophilus TaxID=226011 RepID=A0ABS8GDG1_9ALTE|nr:SRPBCC domain-containing protein [Aestuariibacter halophilus]MCC2617829.1 SRPBCC domain-containing protein [Aestuariibacter halophilus]